MPSKPSANIESTSVITRRGITVFAILAIAFVLPASLLLLKTHQETLAATASAKVIDDPITIQRIPINREYLKTICVDGVSYLVYRAGSKFGMMTAKLNKHAIIEQCAE